MRLKKIGKYFHAEYKTAVGETRTTTTRATEKGEALRIAKEAGIPQLEHAAKAGRLTQQVIGQITTGKKLTLAKAIVEFAEYQRAIGRSSRTVENNRWVFTNWFAFDESIPSLPPSAITYKHINKFINRTDIDAGAVSRKVMLFALRCLFDFFAANGWSAGNPAAPVSVNYNLLTHEQKETKTILPFTESEYKRVAYHLDQHDKVRNRIFWQVGGHLAWETGLRISDVAQLEWDCFGIIGKIIVHTDKRNKRVAVPISAALNTLVTEIPVTSDTYLFPEQRAVMLDPQKRAKLSVQFIRICAAAGVKDKSYHNLRHGFATRMDKEGKTLEDIGELLGHSSTKTTRGYVH